MTDKQLYETREGEQLLTEIERRYGVCVEPGKNGHRTLTSKAVLDAQRVRPTGRPGNSAGCCPFRKPSLQGMVEEGRETSWRPQTAGRK